jgi:hypothetical protein
MHLTLPCLNLETIYEACFVLFSITSMQNVWNLIPPLYLAELSSCKLHFFYL